jgi:hypothetical protein
MDDSPPGSPNTVPHFPVDFPLSLSIADLAGPYFIETHLDFDMENNVGQLPGFEVQADGGGAAAIMQRLVSSSSDDQGPAPPAARRRKRARAELKPVVTLANVLEPTMYKEKENDETRSLEYIRAQREFRYKATAIIGILLTCL